MKDDTNSLRFIYAADLQPGSPYSFRYRAAFMENWQAARAQIMALQPDFMLLGGDLTRDGYYHDFEFAEMRKSLDGMGIPYHTIPGNMDVGNKFSAVHGALPDRDDRQLCLAVERLAAFERYFGASSWTCTYGPVRVSGCCDMLLGSGQPREQEIRGFMGELAALPRSQHHLFLTHYALFMENPDEPDWDITNPDHYYAWYFSLNRTDRSFMLEQLRRAGVTRVLSGHIHCRKEFLWNGMMFDYAPSTTFGQYAGKWPNSDNTPGFYLFELAGTTLRKTFVPTAPLSANPDFFGQGGHVIRANIIYDASHQYLQKHRLPRQNPNQVETI